MRAAALAAALVLAPGVAASAREACDVSFSGTVTEEVGDGEYAFDVTEVHEGSVPSPAVVESEADLAVGRRYRLEASRKVTDDGDERLDIGTCALSDLEPRDDGGFNVAALVFITLGGALILFAAARTKRRSRG